MKLQCQCGREAEVPNSGGRFRCSECGALTVLNPTPPEQCDYGDHLCQCGKYGAFSNDHGKKWLCREHYEQT